MREPERQVRRVGEHVQELALATRAAHAEDALAGELEIREVVVRVEEGHGVSAAARGAREEDGAELGLEALRDVLATVEQGAEDGGGAAREDVAVGDEEEVASLLRIVRRVEQVSLAGEGQAAQIVERAEVGCGEFQLAEQLAVVGGEGQHGVAQPVVQALGLQRADGGFRQPLPVRGEEFGAHGWAPCGSLVF